ncbi:hypothetical protein [Pseudoalteromonas sp. OOF1S-7]|uniref:hypothetical protein n=1 Tax=Pseudoalteromonas sp. OOF1S-7 TaxID=2917757 RepID=UPI001EF58B8A|nr:hypothetical protein [Pseudoalteromonas sp. OOF1S-7]MCG7537913.1 hypothetical protein [Pseudoalteromonas sp. OOF1S-7]
MLFLNFGDRNRAEAFLQQRLAQGFSDTKMKSFQVASDYAEQVKSLAVPERLSKRFPNLPIKVDPTKANNQIGLKNRQIDLLKYAILQGTGKVE